MAVVGAMIMGAAVVHKRRYFRTRASTSLIRRILILSALYLIPAAAGWFFVLGAGLRFLAERGYPVSAGGLVGTVGVLMIGHWVLGDELEAARRLPPRW